MSEIIRTKRGIVYTWTIDDEDVDLSHFHWDVLQTGKGLYLYRSRNLGTRKEYLHRTILERKIKRMLLDTEESDHSDRNTMNNRRSNLRIANSGQNLSNTMGHKDRELPHGVSKRGTRFRAQIGTYGKTIHLGYFNTSEEASEVFRRKHREIHGEFSPYKE